MDPRLNGAGVCELLANGWEGLKQIVPAGRLGEAGCYSESRARAGDAVVESKHPDPAAREDVVHSRVICRVGPRRVWPQFVPARDVLEVRIETLRWRQPAE